ncbi:hypothetical protein [Devosia sp.]|uniref:hypothetical protein n=1 Tax=Devosia sp. TaxID=1871048 RepID=UPI002FCB8A83
MEDIARYIDGTLQDRDVHARDVEVRRIPDTGREEGGAWKFDYEIKFHGQVSLITVAISPTGAA